MNEFNVGDKVVINLLTGGYSGKLKVGSVAIIGEFTIDRRSARMVGELNIIRGWHNLAKIKHAEKWSIYNNTQPWSQLSDKQKGKLLLAAHSNLTIYVGNIGVIFKPAFDDGNMVYQVKKPEPIKPEPTMAELFVSDWEEKESMYKKDVADHMITKGWTKP
jgi:hypothetical protein